MVGVLEHHDGRSAGEAPRDLDGVLDGLGARVEQRAALVEVARGERVQRFADLDVPLVGGHHEAGVREARDLAADGLDHVGHGVADRGDRDARAEVDEVVAVDVDEDRALGTIDVDGEPDGEAGGDRMDPPVVQLLGPRPGDLGHEGPALLDARRHHAPFLAETLGAGDHR